MLPVEVPALFLHFQVMVPDDLSLRKEEAGLPSLNAIA
jgi:hypothetical protein